MFVQWKNYREYLSNFLKPKEITKNTRIIEIKTNKPLLQFELEEDNKNEEFHAFVLLSLFYKNQVQSKHSY